MATSFDELDDSFADVNPNDKPIWVIADQSDDSVRKWLKTEFAAIRDAQRERLEETHFHVDLYKGEEGKRFFDTRRPIDDTRFRQNRSQDITAKVVVNHLFDLTEQKIARLVKFKPAVAIIPTNDEFQDKVSADVAKSLWAHIQNVQRFDKKIQDVLRWMFVTGEGYLWVDWNPTLGPVHPEQKKAKEAGKVVKIRTKDGKVRDLDTELHVGDVELKVIPPDSMFFQFKSNWEESEYCFFVERMHIEEVKKRWPDQASKISVDRPEDLTTRETIEGQQLRIKNQCQVIHFWHKKTPLMPNGKRTVFTKDAILEDGDHPFDHGEFPLERIVDIDIPGEQHGRSFYINARRLANHISNLTTMAVRNQKMAMNPKWFVPRGSVKIDSLGNAPTIVQYSGPQPPVLSAANPSAPELFTFREQLKEDMQQISGIYGQSRGEPPAGVTAAVALQFLDEQENNRQNAGVARYNEFIRRIAKKTLDVAAQKYDASDERMILVLGRDQQWKAQSFDPEHLAKDFTIQIQNVSALPESKAARLSTLIQLREIAPEIMTTERFLDLTGFAQSDKFIDVATAATKSAEVENEKILAGENSKDLEPQEWELHIQHWEVHASKIQEYHVKSDAPKSVLQNLRDHILTHEVFMYAQAEKNPAYMEQLLVLKQFPLVATPPPTEQDVQAQQMAEQEAQMAAQAGAAGELAPTGELPQDQAAVSEGPLQPTGAV